MMADVISYLIFNNYIHLFVLMFVINHLGHLRG